jgi:hypothetical protein
MELLGVTDITIFGSPLAPEVPGITASTVFIVVIYTV